AASERRARVRARQRQRGYEEGVASVKGEELTHRVYGGDPGGEPIRIETRRADEPQPAIRGSGRLGAAALDEHLGGRRRRIDHWQRLRLGRADIRQVGQTEMTDLAQAVEVLDTTPRGWIGCLERPG